MRTYEHIFIVHPDTVGEEYAAVLDKFKGVLTDQGANILKLDEWGTRKMAYPVKKQSRGTYVLVVFESEAGVVAEFERRLRIDEKIIKFQTLLLPKGMEAPSPVKEITPDIEGDEESDEIDEDTVESE